MNNRLDNIWERIILALTGSIRADDAGLTLCCIYGSAGFDVDGYYNLERRVGF
jgi:hypothetical protein